MYPRLQRPPVKHRLSASPSPDPFNVGSHAPPYLDTVDCHVRREVACYPDVLLIIRVMIDHRYLMTVQSSRDAFMTSGIAFHGGRTAGLIPDRPFGSS